MEQDDDDEGHHRHGSEPVVLDAASSDNDEDDENENEMEESSPFLLTQPSTEKRKRRRRRSPRSSSTTASTWPSVSSLVALFVAVAAATLLSSLVGDYPRNEDNEKWVSKWRRRRKPFHQSSTTTTSGVLRQEYGDDDDDDDRWRKHDDGDDGGGAKSDESSNGTQSSPKTTASTTTPPSSRGSSSSSSNTHNSSATTTTTTTSSSSSSSNDSSDEVPAHAEVDGGDGVGASSSSLSTAAPMGSLLLPPTTQSDKDILLGVDGDGLCQRTQIVNGNWVPVHRSQPPYLPPANKTQCVPFAAYLSPTGWDTYEWVPNDAVVATDDRNKKNSSHRCHFTTWDPTLFCQLTKYATVLIVGDSLSWEHHVSTVMLLGIHIHHGYQDRSRIRNVNIGHAVCNGNTRIVYRRDDDLSQLESALYQHYDAANNSLPQILVLNRGAHYVNDHNLTTGLRSTFRVVETWLQKCHHLGITCHFFWRTTVPGHANCHTFRGPVNNLQAMEAHVSNVSNYDNVTITYHWQDFGRQNALAETQLERHRRRNSKGRFFDYRVLDGYAINILRPDDHTDCLHSCNPGKMDVYPQLLLHYLRMDRTMEDVERLGQVFHQKHWYLNVSTVYGHGHV